MNMGGYGPPPPPMPNPFAGRPMAGWLVPMILLIVSVILMGVSASEPWYELKLSNGGSFTLTFELEEMQVKYNLFGSTATDSDDYDGYNFDETGKVMEATLGLVGAAVALAIVAMVFLVIAGLGKISGRIIALFLLLSLVISLIPPLYFAAAVPDAVKEDCQNEIFDSDWDWPDGFIGDDKENDANIEWGPESGWYLSLAAMIMQVVGLIVFLTQMRYFPPPIRRGYPGGPPPGYPYAGPPRAPPAGPHYGPPPGPPPRYPGY
jgi:hypothetical protein